MSETLTDERGCIVCSTAPRAELLADINAARARITELEAVVVKAMAVTDVWSQSETDFNSDFATVSLLELEELAAAVEPYRHTALNPLHVASLDSPVEGEGK